MKPNAARIAAGVALSAALLAFLASRADVTVLWQKREAFQPAYAVAALCLFLANLLLRGARLRVLADAAEGSAALADWVRLSALHQMLFTLLPSGLGDVGFPALARRLTGLGFAAAARTVLTSRIQDFWAVSALSATGLLLHSFGDRYDPAVIGIGLATAAALLVWSDGLTRLVGRGAAALRAGGAVRWAGRAGVRIADMLDAAAREFAVAASWPVRLISAALTLASWGLAAAALWSLFAMIGMAPGVGETLLIIGGLNLAGALAAFTVGGLGVGETALAAMLLAIGHPPGEAVAASLIVRPAALLNVLASGAIVVLSARLFRRRRRATRRTGGTEADPAPP